MQTASGATAATAVGPGLGLAGGAALATGAAELEAPAAAGVGDGDGLEARVGSVAVGGGVAGAVVGGVTDVWLDSGPLVRAGDCVHPVVSTASTVTATIQRRHRSDGGVAVAPGQAPTLLPRVRGGYGRRQATSMGQMPRRRPSGDPVSFT